MNFRSAEALTSLSTGRSYSSSLCMKHERPMAFRYFSTIIQTNVATDPINSDVFYCEGTINHSVRPKIISVFFRQNSSAEGSAEGSAEIVRSKI